MPYLLVLDIGKVLVEVIPLERINMIESTLISYITADYKTKSDMTVGMIEWQKIIQDMAPKFKKAGALRQTASQVWNKEGVFRLGYSWEYKDEKSFVECQRLFREAETIFNDKTDIIRKVFANRGVIIEDVIF